MFSPISIHMFYWKTKIYAILLDVFLLLVAISITVNAIFSSSNNMNSNQHFLQQEYTTYPEIKTLLGQPVSIPCNVTLSSPSDAISLILIYHGQDISGAPIYSIDARNKPLAEGQHFMSDSLMKRNAQFEMKSLMSEVGFLKINPTIEDDDGKYWCRVDFRWIRTTISMVTVDLMIPPKDVIIFTSPSSSSNSVSDYDLDKNMSDSQITSKSEYQNHQKEDQRFQKALPNNSNLTVFEGDSLSLTCKSFGAKPPPAIYWDLNLEIVDNSYSFINISNDYRENYARNQFVIQNLTRSWINSKLRCSSRNYSSNFSTPVSASVMLDLILKPLSIEMIISSSSFNSAERLSAGRQMIVSCISHGSKPEAQFYWFLNGRNLTKFSEYLIVDNQVSESVLKFIPSSSDDYKSLICQAINPYFPQSRDDGRLEASLTLNLHYMPHVSLNMRGKQSSSFIESVPQSHSQSIFEGHDMFLQCHVQSNPPSSKIRWFHDGKEIKHDVDKGILISQSSLSSLLSTTSTPTLSNDNKTSNDITISNLMVKKVRLASEGNYSCVAYNSEGRGDSNQLFIEVWYSPRCVTPTRLRFISTSSGFPTNLFCQVDAKPASNVTFLWSSSIEDITINNIEELNQDQYLAMKDPNHVRTSITSKSVRSKRGLHSRINSEFGLYYCWAKNVVGIQSNACVFNVSKKVLNQQKQLKSGLKTVSSYSSPSSDPTSDCKTNVSFNFVTIKCETFSGLSSESQDKIDNDSNRDQDLKENKFYETLNETLSDNQRDNNNNGLSNRNEEKMQKLNMKKISSADKVPQLDTNGIPFSSSSTPDDKRKIMITLMSAISLTCVLTLIGFLTLFVCLIRRKRNSRVKCDNKIDDTLNHLQDRFGITNSNHQSISDSSIVRRDKSESDDEVNKIMSEKYERNNREVDYSQQQQQQLENTKFYQQQFNHENNVLNQSEICLSASILQPDLIRTTGLNEHNFSNLNQSYLQNVTQNAYETGMISRQIDSQMEIPFLVFQLPNGFISHVNNIDLNTNEACSSSLNGSNTTSSSYSSSLNHGVVSIYPSGQVTSPYNCVIQSCPSQPNTHSYQTQSQSPNESMNSTITTAIVHDHVHHQAINSNPNLPSFHSQHQVMDNKNVSSLVPTISNSVRHVEFISHDNSNHNAIYYDSSNQQKEHNQRNHQVNPIELSNDNESFRLKSHTTSV